MDRRELLKTFGLASIGVLAKPFGKNDLPVSKGGDTKLKNWAWITADPKRPLMIGKGS